ncbi:MAG TPA: B-box zinc finger protein [bacterium]|nr:B-box zinc finger protein [bacterium]
MRCRNHPDRPALGYCSRCGKALCSECLVRLSTGNYCEVCANPTAAAPRRSLPWWLIVLTVLVLLVAVRLFVR